MLDATAAPKLASREVGSAEKRCCCGRSAWVSARGAELAAASPRAAHYSSVTGEAAAPGRSQVPDWIAQSGLSCNPAYFGWRLLRPEGGLRSLCVNRSERGGEREKLRAVAAGGALDRLVSAASFHHYCPPAARSVEVPAGATSTKSVMPSNHPILCHPLLLLPSIFPSITVFSSVSLFRWRPVVCICADGSGCDGQ